MRRSVSDGPACANRSLQSYVAEKRAAEQHAAAKREAEKRAAEKLAADIEAERRAWTNQYPDAIYDYDAYCDRYDGSA